MWTLDRCGFVYYRCDQRAGVAAIKESYCVEKPSQMSCCYSNGNSWRSSVSTIEERLKCRGRRIRCRSSRRAGQASDIGTENDAADIIRPYHTLQQCAKIPRT